MDNYFTFKNRYSEYKDCYFRVGKYENGNTALELWSSEEGPITKVTVNPGFRIPPHAIAVKDYSENEGMVAWLHSMDIIEENPIQTIESGWVTIPVYRLTLKGIKILS